MRRRHRVVQASDDVQWTRKRRHIRPPMGLADPQIVTDGGHQQCQPIRTIQNLGRQPAIARELGGQLVIAEQVQIR